MASSLCRGPSRELATVAASLGSPAHPIRESPCHYQPGGLRRSSLVLWILQAIRRSETKHEKVGFNLKQKTVGKRLAAKLREVRATLMHHRHAPVAWQAN